MVVGTKARQIPARGRRRAKVASLALSGPSGNCLYAASWSHLENVQIVGGPRMSSAICAKWPHLGSFIGVTAFQYWFAVEYLRSSRDRTMSICLTPKRKENTST